MQQIQNFIINDFSQIIVFEFVTEVTVLLKKNDVILINISLFYVI